MKYWSRTALTIYKYLSALSNSIDRSVQEIGKSSNSALLQKYESTYFQANKILQLIDRKRKMINLKVAVEQTLCKLDSVSRKILMLVFIDGMKSELVSEFLGVSMRTFFRKKKIAFREFTTILQAIGYDEEFFESEYGGEMWLSSVYNDCVSRAPDDEYQLDGFLIKRVFSEVSKIKLNSCSF